MHTELNGSGVLLFLSFLGLTIIVFLFFFLFVTCSSSSCPGVLVSLGCYNQNTMDWVVKQKHVFVVFLEAGHLRSGWEHGQVLSESPSPGVRWLHSCCVLTWQRESKRGTHRETDTHTHRLWSFFIRALVP